VTDDTLWERHAGWWQQEHADGADLEYSEQILPLVARHLRTARRVLDIGCGEGQVARHLATLGVEVVGLDPTPTQIRVARDRGGGPRYASARAEALPCRSGSFDAVLLCLAIEHVDAFEAAIRDLTRVLEPGGRFVFVLCHPLLQAPGAAWIDDRVDGTHYWKIGSYSRDQRFVDEVAPGVALEFFHRPLSRYVHAMGAAGLLTDDMEEPAPPAGLVADTWGFEAAATIPRVLVISARRVRDTAAAPTT
jgi:SAM-dependent methyltransferase